MVHEGFKVLQKNSFSMKRKQIVVAHFSLFAGTPNAYSIRLYQNFDLMLNILFPLVFSTHIWRRKTQV